MRRQIREACRSSLVFLALGLLTVYVDQAQADTTPPKPIAKVDSPVFDFGTVTQGTHVTHEFSLKNAGDADLNIHRIVPACGCTAASSSGDVVTPGKSATIKVDLDTANFSGDKLKLVRVFTSDMENPSTVLTLKGNIEPNVVIEPSRVSFDNVVRGQASPNVREVKIRVKPESGLQISEIKSLSKMVGVNVLESNATSARFNVTLDPSLPLGELRERLVVNLKGDKGISVNVPVYALVGGTLRLSPGTLSFGIIEGSEVIERSVKLENLGPEAVNIDSINSSDPAVTAGYTVIQAGKNYVLHVKLDPRNVNKDVRALLKISTSSKTEAPLALNVFGIVPPKG